jgi:hypothetical protein
VKTYRRKLSREDVATGTIFIEKRAWTMFPRPMREFPVDVRGQRFATRIVAEDCSCRPPAHHHWHLEAGHFRDRLRFGPGDAIDIVPTDDAFDIRNG